MIYVVSDIHGHYTKLENLLNRINFSKEDSLYILGDIIDRGPDIVKTIRKVMDTPNIHMILGNHEDMFLRYFESKSILDQSLWYQNGGDATDSEFEKLSKEENVKIVNYFKSLPVEYEIEVDNQKFLLVHGNYVSESNKKYFTDSEYRLEVVWNRVKSWEVGPENKIVLFGHTPTYKYYGKEEPMRIYRKGNMIGLDCGLAAISSYPDICRFGCLCLNTMEEYYV